MSKLDLIINKVEFELNKREDFVVEINDLSPKEMTGTYNYFFDKKEYEIKCGVDKCKIMECRNNVPYVSFRLHIFKKIRGYENA